MSKELEKHKKIAIIYSGFMNEYLEYFLELCNQNNVEADIILCNRNVQFDETTHKIFTINSKVKYKSPLSIMKIDKKIKAITNNQGYDYVLSDCFALSNTTSVFHSHTIHKRGEASFGLIHKVIYNIGHLHRILFDRFFYKNCPKIIAASSLIKEDYAKNYSINPDKISIIHPGFNFNQEIEPVHKKENECFTIGISANGFITKGGYILLNAIKELSKKHKNIKARIIYSRHASNLGLRLYVKLFKLDKYIELLGYQKNMADFYQSLDCLVCPSVYEALGRVGTEAMNFKIPVIVSSTTGAKDIIKDGENGFIFERKGYCGKELAKKIEYLMGHKEIIPNVTDNAYKIAQELSWENFAKELFESLYP